MSAYGDEPVAILHRPLPEWQEFLHYLYLPVKLTPADLDMSDPVERLRGWFRFPKRLEFVRPLVVAAFKDWREHKGVEDGSATYVYVTTRRGFATPDNPLNRPGWHCDGFGTDDVNYVWWDRWSTRFALGDFGDVPADHIESMRHFAALCGTKPFTDPIPGLAIEERTERFLYRLSPFVVHTTPEVERPGGMRSFLKISISRHRYNLVGNSRNYLFDYEWKMWPRDAARNDPARSMADFFDDEPETKEHA